MDSATINYDKQSAHFRAITTILAKEYKPTLQWVAPIGKSAFLLNGKPIRIRKRYIAPDNSVLVELADVKPRTKMSRVVYTYKPPRTIA